MVEVGNAAFSSQEVSIVPRLTKNIKSEPQGRPSILHKVNLINLFSVMVSFKDIAAFEQFAHFMSGTLLEYDSTYIRKREIPI